MKTIQIEIENVIQTGPYPSTYSGGQPYYIINLIGGGQKYTKLVNDLSEVIEKEGDVINIAYETIQKNKGEIREIEYRIIKTEWITNSKDLPWETSTIQTTKIQKDLQTGEKKMTQETPKFFQIKGQAYYAHVQSPNTKGEYASNKYELSLKIDENYENKLKSLDIQIKSKADKPEMGKFVSLRANKPPKVISPEGEVLTDIPLIGNGSEVLVSVNLYANRESNYKQGRGGKNCLGFYVIKIENLIPYGSSGTKDLLDL